MAIKRSQIQSVKYILINDMLINGLNLFVFFFIDRRHISISPIIRCRRQFLCHHFQFNVQIFRDTKQFTSRFICNRIAILQFTMKSSFSHSFKDTFLSTISVVQSDLNKIFPKMKSYTRICSSTAESGTINDL